jgi:hypothetical protein
MPVSLSLSKGHSFSLWPEPKSKGLALVFRLPRTHWLAFSECCFFNYYYNLFFILAPTALHEGKSKGKGKGGGRSTLLAFGSRSPLWSTFSSSSGF